MRQHDVAQLQRQVVDGDQIVVGFRRDGDHEVQLQVLETGREDHVGRRQDLVVGHRLVDDTAKPVGAGSGAMVIVRSPLSRSRRRIVGVRSSSRSEAGLML